MLSCMMANRETPQTAPGDAQQSEESGYEYMDHTADVQIHSWGKTFEIALAQQIVAMAGYMTEIGTVEERKDCAALEVEASGDDVQSLVFALMDEFLFRFSTELFIWRSVEVTSIDRNSWTATAVGRGEPWDLAKHPQGTEIKAITYSAMKVEESADRTDIWVIIDI